MISEHKDLPEETMPTADELNYTDYSAPHDDETQWDRKDKSRKLTLQERQREWRRGKCAEYLAKGFAQHEVADILHISEATVSEDRKWLREQAKNSIRSFTQERLPEIFELSLVGLTQIMRQAWLLSTTSKYERNRVMALKLAQECVTERLNMASNADIIEKTAAFVSRRRKVLEELQSNEFDETITSAELPVPEDSHSPVSGDEEPSEATQIEVSH